MKITSRLEDQTLVLSLQGRLDAFHGGELQKVIDQNLRNQQVIYVVVDMSGVDYLSSAGLRVILALYKNLRKRDGVLTLAGLQAYCRDVIEMAGFAPTLPQFASVGEALQFCDQVITEKRHLETWDELETINAECGTFRIIPGSQEPGAVLVMGDVKDVLYSRVSVDHLCSKKFSETEYSIGLGGLGNQLEDYFPIMGEMMTIGGTMVWLPTDGHDTPDFLIPQKDTGQVTLRTGFNVSISGGFNELMMFDSCEEGGTTITTLYRTLFQIARRRRPDFHGVIGLAIRAQMSSVFGSGILKSPIVDFKPANGEMVTAPSNTAEWFEFDHTPRHTDVTGLICGVGADLTADLSYYDKDQFDAVFYINPANVGGNDLQLHNHGVVFSKLQMAPKAVNIEKEIRQVVDNGEFIDMRHLLDSSAISRGFLGVSYIQEFRPDPKGRRGI